VGTIWRSGNQLGTWGVGIFFVLSGTCIHLPAARRLAEGGHTKLDVRQYFRRRFLRIYPPHALVILLSWLAASWLLLPKGFDPLLSVPTATQLWAHIFMLHTFVPGAYYSINCVLWTIAIETHFYLLYPLILSLRRRFRMETICGALFLVMLALHAADWALKPPIQGLATYNFPGFIWQWVLGAVVAEQLVRVRPRALSGALVIPVIGLSALAASALTRVPHGILLLSILGPVSYALVVFLASSMTSAAGVGARILEWIGLRSYSLYLTHPIALTLVAALAAPWLRRPAVILVVALSSVYLLAVSYFQAVERRCLSSNLRGSLESPLPGVGLRGSSPSASTPSAPPPTSTQERPSEV
jgi:peptidoglycan/LPS O-acetylase OafA/YrhL